MYRFIVQILLSICLEKYDMNTSLMFLLCNLIKSKENVKW